MSEEQDLFQHLLADYRRTTSKGGTPEEFVSWVRETIVKHPIKGAFCEPGGQVTVTMPDGRPCPLVSKNTDAPSQQPDNQQRYAGAGFYQKVF